MYKSHSCGEIRKEHIGQEVTLAGWVNRRRDHGGVTFIDLRDREGVVQIVANPDTSPNAHQAAEKIRSEWVIQARGVVRPRPEGMENPGLQTGEIEVEVIDLTVLNPAKTPPFLINEEVEVDEMLRLKHRYLDLRRERMQNNLALRHRVVKFIRDFLTSKGFWEIETPVLFKTTPEGARDYLVPSRVHPGEFYALPQSPQQLKQLLMVAGVEKYFQIARCFRDEDQRGDRQPEFTQLDLEMSFVEREDVISLSEELFTQLVEEVVPQKQLFSKPWPRFTYKEVMERFGKDNPDIRFGFELVEVTDIVESCGFQVFERAVKSGGLVCGLNAEGAGSFSRREIDELTDFAKEYGAKGLAYIALDDQGMVRSPLEKFIEGEKMGEIIEKLEGKAGDLLLFVADQRAVVLEALGQLRLHFRDRFELVDDDVLGFCWIIDFPYVEWNDTEKRWDPSHHLFTSPMPDDVHLLDEDPGAARGQQYDMVLNGYEVGGGSIRIHERELQEKAFAVIGLEPDVAKERFGHMLEAFEFGTPPHGGIAPGIDRICMVLADEPNIREVIAFPKNQAARDVMASAPSVVEDVQLEELHISIVEVEE